MKKLLPYLIYLLALLPASAWAQCNGVFSPNTICGTVAGGIPGQVSTSVLTGIPGGSPGQVQFNNSGAFGGLTNTQLTADINIFTNSLSGAVPASGGGTVTFLRADGTFAASPGPYVLPSNASGSNTATTGTISSGSPSLSLLAAIDFANGQGIRINHAGATFTLNAPTALIISQVGAAGATTYTYTIASLNASGGVGASITNVVTNTGNASLSTTNYNHLSWTAASGGATAYAVYGRTGGGLTLLGITIATTFDDSGVSLLAGGQPDYIPSAPQGAALASWLVTTISSGAGTTTLTLAANAGNNATSQGVFHDDTASIQAAVTLAASNQREVYILGGIYNVTSQITASAHVAIKGGGYSGDSGGGYAGHGITSCSGLPGTVLCALNSSLGVFVFTTNQPIQLRDFTIAFPNKPIETVIGIQINSVAGAGNSNTQSVIERVIVLQSWYAIDMENCLAFRIAGNFLLYDWGGGIIVNAPNYPSFNQASITDNIIWGDGSATSLTNKYQFHITVQAGGDMRIANNKLNGGSLANGIALLGQNSGTQNLEPVVITGNTIEGSANCILWNTANGSFSSSQIVITGNQGWCALRSIAVNTFGGSAYVLAVTITGNSLTVNGGAGLTNVGIDNVTIGLIDGNDFGCAGGCSTSTGIQLGSHTSNVNVGSSNVYDPGFTTQVSDSGTNNQAWQSAWAAFSAGVSCGTATLTTNSSRIKTIGKVTWIEMDFTITALGTCTTNLTFNVPKTAQSSGGANGRETAVNGKSIGCSIVASAANYACTKADATAFLVNERYNLSGVYENQ